MKNWLLDPDVHYLNHGSFGACPEAVMAYREGLLRLIEKEPMDFLVRRLHGELTLQIQALETFLGAEPGTLVLTENATTGVNAVMGSMELRRGETVLLSDQAYFSTRNALRRAAERAGARIRTLSFPVPVACPEDLTGRALEAAGPGVRYAVLDHIASPTGMVFPIRDMVLALKEKGVETLVDGAHGPGHLPLDLAAMGCAWYVGNCHKWICSPRSTGILYTRRDKAHLTRPGITSHLPEDYAPGPDPLRVMFDWTGTPDPTPKLCVRMALDHMATLHTGGWEGLMGRNRHLALDARRLLLDAVGTAPLCPDSMVGCMAAVLLPGLPPPSPRPLSWEDPLQTVLRNKGFEVPVIHCTAGRFLRISAQVYNEIQQYEALADTLKTLL